ncbi:hypothetical protein ACWEVD_18400 [Nocardia thailandica]|uniref:Uncharacterized protein n=1 Tax=Nocardia thailandica TaxID=257275 RepID=A0ABW6PKX3_9NOCA
MDSSRTKLVGPAVAVGAVSLGLIVIGACGVGQRDTYVSPPPLRDDLAAAPVNMRSDLTGTTTSTISIPPSPTWRIAPNVPVRTPFSLSTTSVTEPPEPGAAPEDPSTTPAPEPGATETAHEDRTTTTRPRPTTTSRPPRTTTPRPTTTTRTPVEEAVDEPTLTYDRTTETRPEPEDGPARPETVPDRATTTAPPTPRTTPADG